MVGWVKVTVVPLDALVGGSEERPVTLEMVVVDPAAKVVPAPSSVELVATNVEDDGAGVAWEDAVSSVLR